MKKLIVLFLFTVLFLTACGENKESVEESNTQNAQEVSSETKTKTETVTETDTDTDTESKPVEPVSWQDKVKEVAASKGTETEKFDEISLYANEYVPTEEEVKEFEQYIIKEYKDRKYIMDISNHEYMLGNIFKAQVVEQYYNDGEPMKDFAFDFFQNSKYNYRGVENMTSESTLSNEEQMNEALQELE